MSQPDTGRRYCSARRSDGQPCQKAPIAGGSVCRTHGGSAPQVRRKAALRLQELVNPAIAVLAREMAQADKSGDRQRAANSILDRAGWGRVQRVEQADAKEMLAQRLMDLRAHAEAELADLDETDDPTPTDDPEEPHNGIDPHSL